MTRLPACFFAAVLLAPVAAAAQTGDAASLASGWNAVAARQYTSALQTADTLLRRRPWDRAALVLKIHAASGVSGARGLDAYEQWLGTRNSDDAGLLEPVAIAILREFASGTSDEELRRSALGALALSQVPGASAQLKALTGSEVPLTAPAPDESALLQMLQNGTGALRVTAARALGDVNTDRSRAALQGLLKDPDPLVRTAATVSLAKLGDPSSQAVVDRMLASDVPEVQLAAADAWAGRPGPWVEVVRGLLNNPDGLTRVHAARAIASIDPEAARASLAATLDDANPVMRAEAAAVLDTVDVAVAAGDVAALRKRLRDRDPVVRVAAAKVLLRLVRG